VSISVFTKTYLNSKENREFVMLFPLYLWCFRRPTNNYNYVLTGYQDILVILYLRVLSLKRVVNLVSKVIMFMMLQFQECRLKMLVNIY